MTVPLKSTKRSYSTDAGLAPKRQKQNVTTTSSKPSTSATPSTSTSSTAPSPGPVIPDLPILAHGPVIPDLPILAHKKSILQKIGESAVTILTGETGSGKTTQIPQFVDD